jgi:hypothetical protein
MIMRRRFISTSKIGEFQYFYIEALEDGVSVSITKELEYKIDEGEWVSLKANSTSDTINNGSRIYIKGYLINTTIMSHSFSINGSCNIGGDIRSLSYGDKYANYNAIAASQYSWLFRDCKTIVSASKLLLNIKTLARTCYYAMFEGCTSLVEAPELPATTLASYCYSNMFDGCTNLNYIKMLATDIPTSDCLYNWVNGVSSIGTFVKHPDMTSLPTGVDGIP